MPEINMSDCAECCFDCVNLPDTLHITIESGNECFDGVTFEVDNCVGLPGTWVGGFDFSGECPPVPVLDVDCFRFGVLCSGTTFELQSCISSAAANGGVCAGCATISADPCDTAGLGTVAELISVQLNPLQIVWRHEINLSSGMIDIFLTLTE